MESILQFSGQYRYLSNFFPSPFEWEGILWPTSEHAYQAAKMTDRSGWLELLPLSAGEVKRKGRTVKIRSDWEEVKADIMAEILYAKFTQNTYLLDCLVATYPAHLEEGNTWGDTFWGVCPPGSGNGQNHLGRLLEELRDLFTTRKKYGIITFK